MLLTCISRFFFHNHHNSSVAPTTVHKIRSWYSFAAAFERILNNYQVPSHGISLSGRRLIIWSRHSHITLKPTVHLLVQKSYNLITYEACLEPSTSSYTFLYLSSVQIPYDAPSLYINPSCKLTSVIICLL